MLIEKNYYNVFWYFVFILNDNDFNVFLFFILIMIYLNKYFFFKKITLIFLYWVMIVYVKQNLYITSRIPELENFTLYNGLVMIHPVFIYFFYFTFIFIIVKKIKIKNKLNTNFFLGIITLILGSWWAQQEINWGGWWNWDVVEMVLWILLLKSLIYNHVWLRKTQYNLINYTTSNLYVYLFIFFVFIRLDIIDSVHVFNSFDMIDLNIWFFDQLINLFVLYLVVFFFKFFNHYTFNYKKQIPFIIFLCLIVNILSIYYIVIYTWFICSSIEFDTDISEFINYLKEGQNVAIFLILFLFIKKQGLKNILYIISTYLNYFLIGFFFNVRFYLKLKRYKYTHLSIGLFFYLLFHFYFFDDIKLYEDVLLIKTYTEYFDFLDFFYIFGLFKDELIFFQLFNFDFILGMGYIELPFFILFSNFINFALLTLFEQEFFLWFNAYTIMLVWFSFVTGFIIIYKLWYFSAIKTNI